MPCNCPCCRRGRGEQNIADGYYDDRAFIQQGCNPSSWNKLYGQGEHDNCLFIGVELELEIESGDTRIAPILQDFDSEFFVFKTDGSLLDGVEVCSHPATLKWLHKHPEDWNDILDINELGAQDTCGMHVHLSKNMFVPRQVTRMRQFLYNNYDKILQFSGRTDDRLEEWASVYNPDEGYIGGAISNHYDTWEIRIFAATKDRTTFWANVEFCEALYQYTLSDNPSAWSDFINWLDSADNEKYNNLKTVLKTMFRVTFTELLEV
jgi:hypothetical protein